MALKRKRSTPDFLPSSSDSTSPTPSPPPPTHYINEIFSNCDGAMAYSPSPQIHSYTSSPSHLHSRTRKRFRNKPDEAAIHQTTYDILFAAAAAAAARSPPQTSSPAYSHSQQQSHQSRPQSQSQQPSLHTFWSSLPNPNFNSHLSSTFSPPKQLPLLSSSPTCQDCDSVLHSSPSSSPSSSSVAAAVADTDICMGGTEGPDYYEIAMPVPATVMDAHTAEEEFGCSNCGRLVCDVCAIMGDGGGGGGRDGGWVRSGDGSRGRERERRWGSGSGSESERECLGCRIDRGKKGVKWVGGIGWMP